MKNLKEVLKDQATVLSEKEQKMITGGSGGGEKEEYPVDPNSGG